jgi:hypothetical protein
MRESGAWRVRGSCKGGGECEGGEGWQERMFKRMECVGE